VVSASVARAFDSSVMVPCLVSGVCTPDSQGLAGLASPSDVVHLIAHLALSVTAITAKAPEMRLSVVVVILPGLMRLRVGMD
jgi:hypothetical protein